MKFLILFTLLLLSPSTLWCSVKCCNTDHYITFDAGQIEQFKMKHRDVTESDTMTITVDNVEYKMTVAEFKQLIKQQQKSK